MNNKCDRCGIGAKNFLVWDLPDRTICLCDECCKIFLMCMLKFNPILLIDLQDYATPEKQA